MARLGLLAVLACVALCGCRKVAVEQHLGRVETSLSPGDPPHIIRSPNADAAGAPWYRQLQVVLEHKPQDDTTLQAQLSAQAPAVKNVTSQLLQEIKQAVDAQRNKSDRWSLLALACNSSKRDLQLRADVVLTTLYARRPVIAFNNVPLDLCIAKLCRECGLQDSQPKTYNPRIYWSKLNVSALEAIDDILGSRGFQRRFSDVAQELTLRPQDHASRDAFIEAAANAIVAKGELINRARPALTVSLKETQPAKNE